MLSMKNIDVTLGKGTKLERQILKGLNLKVNSEEFVIVIGGNGAGKSTMLNIISGFLKPNSGNIIIDGLNGLTMSQNSRAALVAKVAQDPRVGTIESMTISENMAFAYKRGQRRALLPFLSNSRRELFKKRLSMLNMGLESRLDEVVINLSGGQRQALSLVMASLAESNVLLLDEITASLDPKTAESVMSLANKIVREEKRTCIMITHNMRHAIKYGDRLLVLKEGRFIKEFTGQDKASLSEGRLSAEFGV